MESVVYIDGKAYRRGYTTGTTATAAVVAAAYAALGDDALACVPVKLPSGMVLDIPVSYHPTFDGTKEGFEASAKKDGGDDIDQTNGLEIFANVLLTKETDIIIEGGIGVGIVTKPGLQVPIGDWAINPVPRQMIIDNLRAVIGENQGAKVRIHIPHGEAVAKKTFNPKLGIVGGISIIGTTGIVEPMSEEAWKKSLEIELRQLKLKGGTQVLMVPGNHGEKFAMKHLEADEVWVVGMSNFVGYMLMAAVKEGFKHALLVGHVGKLAKLASGIFHTHSRVADGRNEAIVAALIAHDAPYELLKTVLKSNTTDEAAAHILEAGYGEAFNTLAKAAASRGTAHTYEAIQVDVVLYDMSGRLLGTSASETVLASYRGGIGT